MSQYGASSYATRQPHTSQANGFAKPVRSPTWDSMNQSYENDQSYLSSDRMNELHRKPSGDMNAISNDPDSVMEYYKSHNTNKKSTAASLKGKPKKKTSKGGPGDPNWTAVEHDQNNWIHRDKLKEIETKELEAAGFRVGGRASGTNSRSQSTTRKPRDRRGSEAAGQNQTGDERHDGRRVVSPIPAEDEDALDQDHSWRNSTTFEELAAGGGQPASPRATTHNGRPSTSRIPLPKTSGLPVPASAADRDAPLSRSRAGSGNWNGDAIAANAKPTGKTGPPGNRKTSAKTQPKGRNVSGTSPPKRPGTSGAAAAIRPVTSHKPEGEAPWIATMYKPDPRLPPDQQIIPTHAKRMQQEQWENEGRVGSMYDKDFRLLNTEDMDGKRLSQIDPIALEKERERENGQWPLPSPEKSASPDPSLEKTDTKANEQGGAYKLTPTIPQGPRVPSPKLAPPIEPAASHPQTHDFPSQSRAGKEGVCCIVM
ncbi:hypothetical protein SNOG_11744 [Parastagonospora nodorum SN15]|uniref:Uncharacterized protein n=1 Tax=Phaeosphaeria nodorum (strain SN15 / ATCC MYA-4574 / FGSC 10173) TaxID=321614 RepID=Q0U920_PHANO|nr:hypothetical protein SNOG_11744 [Parastagonospora nodorum SN15]EAT80788.2 hypothetical protein SNOG_11744 [Parastagonospora nodorum SN15]